MSELTLKDVMYVKPPFVAKGTGVFCKTAYGKDYIICFNGIKYAPLLENEAVLIAAALNEKWERDFGEMLQWIFMGKCVATPNVIQYKCPKCNYFVYEDINNEPCNYCPNCGQKLLPPKGVEA